MSDNGARGCIKYGFIGCLTLFALGIGLIFLLGLLQFTVDQADPEPESKDLSHELPTPPEPPDASADVPDMPEVLPLPGSQGDLPATPTTGRVIFDIDAAEFTISVGEPGEALRLVADYDAGSFRLEEELSESSDGTWLYEVTLESKGSLGGIYFRGNRHRRNQLELIVPPDHPIDLEGRVGVGETELNLGGLWLRDVDLDLGTGRHFVEFREPLREPMADFRLKSGVGEAEVRGVGNASPRAVEVKHQIGSLLLDLEGDWRADAEIDVNFQIGECRVWLPDDVYTEVDRGRVSIGEQRIDPPRESDDIPEDAPTLRLRLSGSIGELRVR